MQIKIAPQIVRKIKEKHDVDPNEIDECFANRTGNFLEDTREQHRTRPPSQWFLSETDQGRLLKIVFIEEQSHGEIHIKTAYQPDENEVRIYEKYGF